MEKYKLELISIIFYILIILAIIPSLKKIPERIQDLKRGKKAVLYLFLIIPVYLVIGMGAVELSKYVPILKWGWLGHNIIFGPLSITNSGYISPLGMIFALSICVFVMFACLICNYDEEEFFRKKWIHVPLWAALHLVMGIPIWAVIPILSVGLIYKYIYDKHSLCHAYAAHFATNMVIIVAIILLMFYSMGIQ